MELRTGRPRDEGSLSVRPCPGAALGAKGVGVLAIGVLACLLAGQAPGAEEQGGAASAVVSLGRGEAAKTKIDVLAEKFDAAADTWESEVLSESAGGQFKKIGAKITGPVPEGAAGAVDLRAVAADDFRCEQLVPGQMQRVFEDGVLTVDRQPVPGAAPLLGTGDEVGYRGAKGLKAALGEITKALGPVEQVRCKIKVVGIEMDAEGFSTKVDFQASGRGDAHGRQINATWMCQWAYPRDADEGRPRLRAIAVQAYEQVTIRAPGGTLYRDCTAALMADVAHYGEQVLRSVPYWSSRLYARLNVAGRGLSGLAVGDVNGDGLEDVYVCDAGGLPNRLYVQQLDGTVRDMSAAAGVDWIALTTSALLIDLDNDGDEDLVVATVPKLLVMENDGSGKFTWRYEMEMASVVQSMAAADYDQDGRLDLFLCGYTLERSTATILPLAIPYYDANNGAPNTLLRNQGDFQFEDVTQPVGLDQNNTRFSFAAAWADYDQDGDVDLYVANDFGRNNLYRNSGGRFEDVAAAAGVEDVATGMSVAWGDYDRDGWEDIYVGNMYSSAGHRVGQQDAFAPQNTQQGANLLRRTARGNTLFRNDATGGFEDVTMDAAVNMGRWAWSSRFTDFNSDGWPDLVVANGFLTNEDSGDL